MLMWMRSVLCLLWYRNDRMCYFFYYISVFSFLCVLFHLKPTCGSLRPLLSESDVSLYWDEAISTSVDALLLFFSGLHASEISLAPSGGWHGFHVSYEGVYSCWVWGGVEYFIPFCDPVFSVVSGAISAWETQISHFNKLCVFQFV